MIYDERAPWAFDPLEQANDTAVWPTGTSSTTQLRMPRPSSVLCSDGTILYCWMEAVSGGPQRAQSVWLGYADDEDDFVTNDDSVDVAGATKIIDVNGAGSGTAYGSVAGGIMKVWDDLIVLFMVTDVTVGNITVDSSLGAMNAYSGLHLWYSQDDGATWIQIDDPEGTLPEVDVQLMNLDPSSNANTWGTLKSRFGSPFLDSYDPENGRGTVLIPVTEIYKDWTLNTYNRAFPNVAKVGFVASTVPGNSIVTTWSLSLVPFVPTSTAAHTYPGAFLGNLRENAEDAAMPHISKVGDTYYWATANPGSGNSVRLYSSTAPMSGWYWYDEYESGDISGRNDFTFLRMADGSTEADVQWVLFCNYNRTLYKSEGSYPAWSDWEVMTTEAGIDGSIPRAMPIMVQGAEHTWCSVVDSNSDYHGIKWGTPEEIVPHDCQVYEWEPTYLWTDVVDLWLEGKKQDAAQIADQILKNIEEHLDGKRTQGDIRFPYKWADVLPPAMEGDVEAYKAVAALDRYIIEVLNGILCSSTFSWRFGYRSDQVLAASVDAMAFSRVLQSLWEEMEAWSTESAYQLTGPLIL